MMRRLLTAGALVALSAAPLAAQRAVWWNAEISGIGMRLNSQTGPSTQKWSGASFGFQSQIVFLNRITLDLGYWQGKLNSVGSGNRDVVEGFTQLGVRPMSWLSLRAGPHAWTYISDAGTQRWFLWEGRGRAQGQVLPAIQSYLEVWKVFSANVNVPQAFQTGMGGEGGLSLRIRDVPFIPQQVPVRIRLAYGIERVRMNGTQAQGSRAEVLDRLTLGLGVEAP
ncbi:MAG TPA: hypothetical protein VNG35_15455 [Gemmatimonadales bacterium]|nr:hypothetical protein [Gemmatimonadales bacterium]